MRRWAVNIAAAVLVLAWVVPVIGLLVTSLRARDQISATGWWRAALPAEVSGFIRAETIRQGDVWVAEGNLAPGQRLRAWGIAARAPEAQPPGTQIVAEGMELAVAADGQYRLRTDRARSLRIFFSATAPPRATLENYAQVIGAGGLGRAFGNTLTVAIPATILPVLIAAFAGYALAWMRFPGRALLGAGIVGLMAVPLQLALIPVLRLYNDIGLGKGYVAIWLAHTGFGLPIALHLLRHAMSRLPRAVIESARLDGASELRVFWRIALPLAAPSVAALTALQFLWVWNDLLVATVFLGNRPEHLVLTGALREMMGSRGGDWAILAASAFVSMTVPIAVFVGLRRLLERGVLAGNDCIK